MIGNISFIRDKAAAELARLVLTKACEVPKSGILHVDGIVVLNS